MTDAAPLAQEPGLFTFARATSFHRQIFPDETLSFGFSASAMHWLSGKPGFIADHVHAAGGGTSLELMRNVVRFLRTACPYRAITLTYTDLPCNDFSSLFR